MTRVVPGEEVESVNMPEGPMRACEGGCGRTLPEWDVVRIEHSYPGFECVHFVCLPCWERGGYVLSCGKRYHAFGTSCYDTPEHRSRHGHYVPIMDIALSPECGFSQHAAIHQPWLYPRFGRTVYSLWNTAEASRITTLSGVATISGVRG
jgi:hypothetical protein